MYRINHTRVPRAVDDSGDIFNKMLLVNLIFFVGFIVSGYDFKMAVIPSLSEFTLVCGIT